MTRKDILDYVVANNSCKDLNRETIKSILDLAEEAMKNAFIKGEDVNIQYFGNFRVKEKKERFARDFKQNTKVLVPAQKTVKFKLSNQIKIK